MKRGGTLSPDKDVPISKQDKAVCFAKHHAPKLTAIDNGVCLHTIEEAGC